MMCSVSKMGCLVLIMKRKSSIRYSQFLWAHCLNLLSVESHVKLGHLQRAQLKGEIWLIRSWRRVVKREKNKSLDITKWCSIGSHRSKTVCIILGFSIFSSVCFSESACHINIAHIKKLTQTQFKIYLLDFEAGNLVSCYPERILVLELEFF